MATNVTPPTSSDEDDGDRSDVDDTSESLLSDMSGGVYGTAVRERELLALLRRQGRQPRLRGNMYGVEAESDGAELERLPHARSTELLAKTLGEATILWQWETSAAAGNKPLTTPLLVIGFNGAGENALEAVFPIKCRLGTLVVPPVPHIFGQTGNDQRGTASNIREPTSATKVTRCDLFRVDESNTILLLLCRGPIPVERAFSWCSTIMADVDPQSITMLESLHLANYITDRESGDEILPPLLRALHTSAAGTLPITPFLESPNVVEGAPAAVMSHCQLRNIPSRLYLSLLEVAEGNNVITQTSLTAFEPCAHLSSFRSDRRNLSVLATILRWSTAVSGAVGRPPPGTGQVGAQLPPITCGTCATTRRVHACLHCVTLVCWGDHMRKHLETAQHNFALDVTRTVLYCAACGDYVYDTNIDWVIRQLLRRNYDDAIALRDEPTSTEKLAPVKRVRFTYSRLPDRNQHAGATQKCHGLRGLYNLGSTCFMNTILQSCLHNPMLQSYFFSDAHNPKQCQLRQNGASDVTCLACLMDDLFVQCFSGHSAPYAPHQFLHAMWTFSTEMAGYEQQDAHEFFISLLDGLHLHCNGTPTACTCVIHKVFKGVLQSDVTCLTCGNVSTAHDPFFDISVDLSMRQPSTDAAHTGPVNGQDTSNGGSHARVAHGRNTLIDCLRRFTQPEQLGSTDVLCERCGSYQASTKQLSIFTAPCVLAVHLKRFERTAANSVKIDLFSQFPTELNLAPFISANLSDHSVDDSSEQRLPKLLSLGFDYSLFAVITHLGTLESGHYVIYTLSGREWFKIDDDTVTKVQAAEVTQQCAYMLFYIKRQLDYGESTSVAS